MYTYIYIYIYTHTYVGYKHMYSPRGERLPDVYDYVINS